MKKAQVESNTDSDYVNNINAMIQQNCNVIVSAGYKLADATLAAAKKNPDINFAIVDYTDYKSPPRTYASSVSTPPRRASSPAISQQA